MESTDIGQVLATFLLECSGIGSAGKVVLVHHYSKHSFKVMVDIFLELYTLHSNQAYLKGTMRCLRSHSNFNVYIRLHHNELCNGYAKFHILFKYGCRSC